MPFIHNKNSLSVPSTDFQYLKKQILYINKGEKSNFSEALTIDCPIGLAPMAGITDKIYREICVEWGVGFTTTELVSAKGLRYRGIEASYKYLDLSDKEIIPVIQLFGFEAIDFYQAVLEILDHPILKKVKIIDINMGCPVSKVCKTGAGAALMNNPKLAQELVLACQKVCHPRGIPVTVKFRKGYAENEKTCVDFALSMAEVGVAAMTIHGRTRQQMYSGQADWQAIGEASYAVKEYTQKLGRPPIPVFVNGDITSYDSAKEALAVSQADGIQIGRAAMGNPTIFYELRKNLCQSSLEGLNLPLSTEEMQFFYQKENYSLLRLKLAYNHYRRMIAVAEQGEIKNKTHAFRKILLSYLQGFTMAASLRKQVLSINNPEEFEDFYQLALKNF